VNARASYGLTLGGTRPDLLLVDDENAPFSPEIISPKENFLELSYSSRRQWKLCLPKVHHPLLLQQHRHYLQEARKDVADATAV